MPYLDLVVVAAGDEEGLLLVEADPAHGAVVLVELVQKGAHPQEEVGFGYNLTPQDNACQFYSCQSLGLSGVI